MLRYITWRVVLVNVLYTCICMVYRTQWYTIPLYIYINKIFRVPLDNTQFSQTSSLLLSFSHSLFPLFPSLLGCPNNKIVAGEVPCCDAQNRTVSSQGWAGLLQHCYPMKPSQSWRIGVSTSRALACSARAHHMKTKLRLVTSLRCWAWTWLGLVNVGLARHKI